MKMRRPHRVPLAHQTIDVLKNLRALTGKSELIVPGARGRGRPLSENTLNAALRRLGYTKDEMTAHGFRAAASSILNESGFWNPDAIQAQTRPCRGQRRPPRVCAGGVLGRAGQDDAMVGGSAR